MIDASRVLRRAAILSVGDFFAVFPIKTYLIALLPRGLFQMAFYALLAQFIAGPAFALFALVGTTAQVTYQSLFTVATGTVVREQGSGTIPLLVAAPGSALAAVTGRSCAAVGNGMLSGLIPLLAGAPFLGLALTVPSLVGAVGVLLVIAVSAYAFALVLGGIGLRWRGYHNVLSSLAGTGVTILCGAYIPRSTLPEWAQVVGNLLPATHGLEALRGVLGGGAAEGVLRAVGAELLIAAAYLVLAELSFRLFLSRARSAGTLDFH